MDSKTELEVLISNLKQTEDPLKEIEAQADFITNELRENHISTGEFIHRFSLLSQAETYFTNNK